MGGVDGQTGTKIIIYKHDDEEAISTFFAAGGAAGLGPEGQGTAGDDRGVSTMGDGELPDDYAARVD